MSHYVDPTEQEELTTHPGPRQYVTVALVLAVITAMEVSIYYMTAIRSLLVPLLIFFAVIKFALVALWFMHLRFDSHLFRRLFVTGLVLALGVFAVVLVIFFFALGGAVPAATG
jgi:caa(3)-type oxidase subunit IV